MNNETLEARLWRAFIQAGWSPTQVEIFYTTDLLIKLHKKVYPTPFINLEIEAAVTEQSLEDAKAGHGMMYKAVIRKFLSANIRTILPFVMMTETQAVRVFGGSKTKAFRAAEALIKKHGLHFGFDPVKDL